MASRRGYSSSRCRYSSELRKAYWIGVGINAERHGDSDRLLEHHNSAIRNSARKGYDAENTKDLTRTKFK